MLDNIHNVSSNIKIQACSGGIYKSHPKTFFVKFDINSTMANTLFREKPFYLVMDNEVVVLQVVFAGDGELLAEIIKKADYDAEIICNDNM